MSVASLATQQSNALAAANQAAAAASTASTSSTSSSASSTSTTTSNDALASLTGNFNDFLNLLMTQLQNQDPTSPMDTNQFTSELVQFASVEQQINTNGALTQLISLNQAGELMQSSSMVGDQVLLNTSTLPLQNGSAKLQFTASTAEPVAIAIYNSSGQQVYDTTLTSTAGTNSFTWNGQSNSGAQMADGGYTVAVEGANADGSTTALPFSTVGTISGVQTSSNGTLELELGATSVPFSSVQQVLSTNSTS
ncbi:MAG TPA: flagellar hook capping FlgD N-terminal domain-containing protein [Acetobacteraceae bacterium]|nr:flagellar hook capping FlgD N-terminal domain-containing protein [Acetobacteraceae bacterium]